MRRGLRKLEGGYRGYFSNHTPSYGALSEREIRSMLNNPSVQKQGGLRNQLDRQLSRATR